MAAYERENTLTESLVLRVPLTDVRNSDGTVLTASAAAGIFGISAGGWGSGTLKLVGEAASGNTKTSTGMVALPVPWNAEATAHTGSSKSWTIGIDARVSIVAATSATLDIEVYRSDGNGGISGSDLCTTAAQDINSATWATKTFTLTATNIEPGDELIVLIRTAVNDSTGANSSVGQVGKIIATYNARM